MNSTRKLISLDLPLFDQNSICGRYLRAPTSNNVLKEGGLRLKGQFKKNQFDMPLVTIITVVRNRVRFIDQCLLSVFNQSYPNIEYIVIDGASTDGTMGIIESYNDLIDYYISEKDDGIYDAMNTGLSLASGEYILFLNSDDWYDKNAVEDLVKVALNNDVDIVHANALAVSDSGLITRRLNGWLNDALYVSAMPLRHETMLVHKNIYNRFGAYDNSFKILGDYEFVIRIYGGSCRFYHLPEPLLYFRMSGVSNENNKERFAERERLFNKIFPFLDNMDLKILSHGASVAERLSLIEKHKGKSELFARSMAVYLASSSVHVNNFLKSIDFWPLLRFLSIISKINKIVSSNLYIFKYKLFHIN